MRHFANILVSWWVIISKHLLWRSVWRVPELISHLLWFIAAIRTAYCPCGWIGAVRRRKGQCWAKHQRYSQNALCLPHTRTLFHFFFHQHTQWVQLQTEDKHWRKFSQRLNSMYLWTNTWLKSRDQAFLINHRFIQVCPQTDYEMEQISIQSCVRDQKRHCGSESWLNTPLALVGSNSNTELSSEGTLLPGYIRSRSSMWWWV